MIKFYHGTSDKLQINSIILPASQTNILREDWRKKLVDKVFLTVSRRSAEMYAKKAASKWGGNSVVYEVIPIGTVYQTNGIEYIADKAQIVSCLT